MVRYDSRIIRVMQVYGRLTTACSINKHYNYYLITHLLVTVEAGSIIINPMLLACLLELFISKLGRGTYYRRKVFSCFSFVAFFNCWDSAFSQTAPPPAPPPPPPHKLSILSLLPNNNWNSYSRISDSLLKYSFSNQQLVRLEQRKGDAMSLSV